MTPGLTLDYLTIDTQRFGQITAEVGGSSPPRPTTRAILCLMIDGGLTSNARLD